MKDQIGRATIAYTPTQKRETIKEIIGDSNELLDFDKILLEDETDPKFGLPDVWARHTQKRTKQDDC